MQAYILHNPCWGTRVVKEQMQRINQGKSVWVYWEQHSKSFPSFSVYMCCMCVYSHSCVHAGTHVCTCMRRPAADISSCLTPLLPNAARLASQGTPGICLSSLAPCLDDRHIPLHLVYFNGCLAFELRCSCVHGKYFIHRVISSTFIAHRCSPVCTCWCRSLNQQSVLPERTPAAAQTKFHKLQASTIILLQHGLYSVSEKCQQWRSDKNNSTNLVVY